MQFLCRLADEFGSGEDGVPVHLPHQFYYKTQTASAETTDAA